MRRIYLSVLLAALLTVSCNSVESVDITKTEVAFAVIVDDQSRGAMVESPEQMGSIGVYCAHTASEAWSTTTLFEKMKNQRLDYNEATDTWVYDTATVPTWGNSTVTDKYTFWAYSPFASSLYSSIIEPSIQDGSLVVRYDIPTDCGSQPDLMLAVPRKDIYPQVGGSVSLSFKHALASVGFSVKGPESEIITAIALSGVVAGGSVTISDSGEIVWPQKDDPIDIEYSALIDTDIEPDLYTPTSLTLDNGYLMMIPQECSSVEVVATIYNTDERKSRTVNFEMSTGEEWQAGTTYNYTLNIANYDYTIEGTANCYMLHPTGEEQIFYIPVEGRINYFWRDYTSGSSQYEDRLSSSDKWCPTLLWHDFDCDTDGLCIERVTSGFTPNEEVTPDCAPDFTTLGTRSAMKITLPSSLDQGNFLVAVEFEGEILWSWHFWVTDYNPDAIAKRSTASSNQYIYWVRGEEGEVHRYDDSNLWGTLYQDKFIMDRNLGARGTTYEPDNKGVLHYQFGRKDPFPYNLEEMTTSSSRVSFAEAVQNPTCFYTQSDRPYSWSEEGLINSDKYLWDDVNLPNSAESSGKSLFDPSPLGWRIPRYDAYTVLDKYNCPYSKDDNALIYQSSILFPMTGHRSNSSGNSRESGNQGNLRLSTSIDSSFAYNLAYNPYIDTTTNNTRTDGFCIRCIEE